MIKLNVRSLTNTKNITNKPELYITIDLNDKIISSKSKIRNTIQKTKNRKDKGKILTLYESKPHSNTLNILNNLYLTTLANNNITKGTETEIKKYNKRFHIINLTNK